MTDQTVLDIGTNAIWVTIQVAAPILISALIAGLVISIIQAATQINEQTLSFIPKIVVMTIALVVCGPWMIQIMTNFTIDLINGIPKITH